MVPSARRLCSVLVFISGIRSCQHQIMRITLLWQWCQSTGSAKRSSFASSAAFGLPTTNLLVMHNRYISLYDASITMIPQCWWRSFSCLSPLSLYILCFYSVRRPVNFTMEVRSTDLMLMNFIRRNVMRNFLEPDQKEKSNSSSQRLKELPKRLLQRTGWRNQDYSIRWHAENDGYFSDQMMSPDVSIALCCLLHLSLLFWLNQYQSRSKQRTDSSSVWRNSSMNVAISPSNYHRNSLHLIFVLDT